MLKPTIVVCTTSYYPFVGGAEIAVEEVARRLTPHFDFLILTSRRHRRLPRREVRPEGTVLRFGFGTRFDKWLLPLLALFCIIPKSEIRDSKSVLWGMDISQGSAVALAIKMIFPRLPFVLTVQYGESEERLRQGRYGLIARVFRAMLAQADCVTAISSYLLSIVRESGYCGPAEIIHNGVDIGKFQISNPKLQRDVQFQNQKSKTIITVSRLVKKNGVDTLIQAIAEVKKSIPDIRCLIVGDGPERKNLELQATSYPWPTASAGRGKLQANIQFLGEVPHSQLSHLLHQASVFVRPSRSEGMGNAFVEALAAGTPVIGTPVGGIVDIIEDGETGLFTQVDDPRDLADKIIRLLGDPEFNKRIVERGRGLVEERFAWDHIVSAYVRVFQNVCIGPRLLIATPLFPPEIGGPSTYTKLLTDELPRRGVGVRVVAFRTVRHLPKILRHARYFLRLVSAGRGMDTIFAQDPVSVGLPAYLACFFLRKKFYLKVVGDYAWEQYQQRESRITNHGLRDWVTIEDFQIRRFDLMTEVRRSIERFVARRARRVIVPSEYMERIVGQWGIRGDKISVIYNGFTPPIMTPSPQIARERLGIPQDAFVIISSGRLVPWKGFGQLIEAMLFIRKEIPSARLYIIGSGPEKSVLDDLIRAKGLGDAVLLIGDVAHEDVLLYMRAGDIFILNSAYEGFSHTLLEAMAMGIPSAAAAAGGNQEIIIDRENGLLYKDRNPQTIVDTVFLLYQDTDLRRRLAEAATKSVARFTKEEMIGKTVKTLYL